MTARTRGARRHDTAAEIVGTVGVLGVAATIAGLSGFGSFTDSTQRVNTDVDTGVLSIDVAGAGDSLSMPFGGGLMLAGVSRNYRLDLVDDGNVPLGTLTMTSRATTSSILDTDTDTVNGLQLSIENRTVPWTVSGSVYSCGGTQSTVYSGPIVTADRTITGPSSTGSGAASTDVGGVDHLLLTASIPSSASGDAFAGATSSLDFVFTGTQRAGSTRWHLPADLLPEGDPAPVRLGRGPSRVQGSTARPSDRSTGRPARRTPPGPP